MIIFSPRFLAGSLLFCGFGLSCLASNPVLDVVLPKQQVSGEVLLPVWEEEHCRESFDIRIWPYSVVMWLERENLRDLISDPDIPDEEKAQLKQVLALQNAWRKL